MKKRALVLAMVVSLALVATAFAGPYVGLRYTWGGPISPVGGIQYDGEIGLFAEAYKTNFWDFTLDGLYMLEGGVTVPFYLNEGYRVPLGVAFWFEVVDRDPGWAFGTSELLGFTGLWVDGGNGNMLRFDLYFNAETILPALGFHVDLHGLWRIAFGREPLFLP